MTDILLEQLVYGSFPFWDRGYDVLARSPGFRAEWLADVLSTCRGFGEAPAGIAPAPALFALRLASGPWAIVGVGPQGVDDRGRPGALAFHALLASARDYRRAGSNPFAFAGALRRDWSADTRSLVAFSHPVEAPGPTVPPADPRSRRVVEALSRGRRVALESGEPIEALAREVWAALPESARRRASVATWASGNANRFDLVALPRLAGAALDRSYVDPSSIEDGPVEPAGSAGRLPLSRRSRRAMAFGGLAGLVAAGLIWRGSGEPGNPAGPPATIPEAAEGPIGAEERARIVLGLEALADRFEAFEVGRPDDPGAWMARFSGRLRYRGAALTPAELARLAADPEPDPDRDRALAWHERLKGFADDRPLPDDFARLPLARQLALLARSFHVEPPARPEAIPEALGEALSRDGPIRPTPLASRYPALGDYARFLGRLPRRKAAGSP